MKPLLIFGIIAGALGIGTVGYLVLKPKKTADTGGGGNASDEEMPSGDDQKPGGVAGFLNNVMNYGSAAQNVANTATAGSAASGTEFKISDYEEKLTGATDLVIGLASPRPKKGTIKSTNKIKVSGMGKFDGEYRVYANNGVWIDSQGNIGALYVKTGKATQEKKANTATGIVTKL